MGAMNLLDILAWGGLTALLLGAVLPLVATATLKRWTTISKGLLGGIATGVAALVLVPATLVLSGEALWAGPFAVVVFALGAVVTATTLVLVWAIASFLPTSMPRA